MFVYFISITYGIYFSTILDFIFYNRALNVQYQKTNQKVSKRARNAWDIFDIDLVTTRTKKSVLKNPLTTYINTSI